MIPQESFAPTIVLKSGKVITPTGNEWILYFAIMGCEWAIEHLKDKKIVLT